MFGEMIIALLNLKQGETPVVLDITDTDHLSAKRIGEDKYFVEFDRSGNKKSGIVDTVGIVQIFSGACTK